MNSTELNAKLSDIADQGDIAPRELVNCGKAVAYYGWFWRSVDFDERISFAYANGEGFDVPRFVGFCENNKWGYEQYACTAEQSAKVRAQIEQVAEHPTTESAQTLYDFMQLTRPAHVIGDKRWSDGE